MKRVVWLFGIATIIAVAVVYSLRSDPPDEPMATPTQPESSQEEQALYVTVRNVTGQPVTYVTFLPAEPDKAETTTIAPGEVRRHLSGSPPLQIRFNDGATARAYSLEPGAAKSLRYDQFGKVDLYGGSHGRTDVPDLGPFVATPQVVVEEMLRVSAVKGGDVIYDLGCGDGRFIITAAKRYGARGTGIDIDAELIAKSKESAREAGVEKLVEFVEMDAMKADVSDATLLTLYMLPESLALLRPKFDSDLKLGARVVTHNYPIVGWEHKQVDAFEFKDETGETHSIFAYVR